MGLLKRRAKKRLNTRTPHGSQTPMGPCFSGFWSREIFHALRGDFLRYSKVRAPHDRSQESSLSPVHNRRPKTLWKRSPGNGEGTHHAMREFEPLSGGARNQNDGDRRIPNGILRPPSPHYPSSRSARLGMPLACESIETPACITTWFLVKLALSAATLVSVI